MKKILLMILLAAAAGTFAQTDCTDAMIVCGNTNFEGLHLDGLGGLQEISSCGSEEHNSLWLKIHIASSGTLAFNIIPDNPSLQEDYDFFLFSYISCEDNTEIRCSTTHPASAGLSSNYTGTNDAETDSFEGPGQFGDGFVRSVDAEAGETYMLVIDRPSGNSDFSLEWTGTATFNDPPAFAPLPVGVSSLDIMKCDDDGNPDGSTVFDLTQNTPLVLGGQPDLSVHYFASQSDCLLGVNEIPNPESFANTSDPQSVYVRLVNDVTECFSTADFLIGTNGAVSLEANQFAICDDASDGDAFNGQASFDMFAVTQIVFPDSAGYSVQYFLTRQDAENNVNPLPANFYNTTPNQQTVYIKADNGSCRLILPIDLQVRFIPQISSAQLTQCDFGPNPDGISTFNLSTADDLFTGSDPDLSVAYFKDAAAMAGNTALPSAYTNETEPQTILVKITDALTGCSATNTLTLHVNTVTPQQIAPLQSCDANGNGFAPFDLTAANLATSPQETAAFYKSLQDALLQQNAIGNIANYTNATAYEDSVFARIDDAVNGCSGIIEIALHVNPLPAITEYDEATLCINQPGAQATIDAGQLPSGNFTFTWQFNNSPLPDTSYSIGAGQTGTYTVNITNADGCTKTRTIQVLPADVPAIQSVTADGHSITVNLMAGIVGNYRFSVDQPNGPFQAGNFFADIGCGPHTAYVDGGNGCGTNSFPFEIFGIPAYFSPNDDGFADRWNMTCGENHPDTTLYIFDRFGKLIKQINAAGKGWDGTYNGQPLPADDYWYILSADDGTTTKGHFALKR